MEVSSGKVPDPGEAAVSRGVVPDLGGVEVASGVVLDPGEAAVFCGVVPDQVRSMGAPARAGTTQLGGCNIRRKSSRHFVSGQKISQPTCRN